MSSNFLATKRGESSFGRCATVRNTQKAFGFTILAWADADMSKGEDKTQLVLT